MPLAFNTLMNDQAKKKHTCDYLNIFQKSDPSDLIKRSIGSYKAAHRVL